jgi:hypothetical protein
MKNEPQAVEADNELPTVAQITTDEQTTALDKKNDTSPGENPKTQLSDHQVEAWNANFLGLSPVPDFIEDISATDKKLLLSSMKRIQKEASKKAAQNDIHSNNTAKELSRKKSLRLVSGQSTTPIKPVDLSTTLYLEQFPHPIIKTKDGIDYCVGLYNHTDNLKFLLKKYGISIKYNVISKSEVITIPYNMGVLEDNKSIFELEFLSSICSMNDFPIHRLQQQITAIANENPYNPVIEYATVKEWDGTDRITQVCDTATAKEFAINWKFICIRKSIYSAIGAAINNQKDKFSFKGSLVLQGDQGLGKTPWIRILTGSLSDSFLEGHELNPANKDSVIAATQNWIVELGELDATTKKADVALLKAFLTKYEDEYRRPFAAKNTKSPRRTIFIGTVNPEEFLVDVTGNDRFWTLPVTHLDLNALEKMDIQQVWAQAYTEVLSFLKRGIRPWLLNEEEKIIMRSINEQYRSLVPIEEVLSDVFANTENSPKTWHGSTTAICALIGYEKIDPKTRSIAKAWLTKNIGEERKTLGIRGFTIPEVEFNKGSVINYSIHGLKKLDKSHQY